MKNKNNNMINMVFIATFLSAASAVLATENKTDNLHINTIINAKALKRSLPKYPNGAASKGIEGWVALSFVIEEDGSTSNVLIEDSSNRVFEREARKTVQRWLYSPAEQDGRAIQQCETRVRLEFNLHDTPQGASRKFIAKYKSANQFLEQGNIDEFKRVIGEIEQTGRINSYEETYFKILTFELAAKSNNDKKQLSAIEFLLGQKDILSEEQYEFYAEKGFALASNSKQYFKAESIYEKVQNAYPEGQFITTYRSYYDQIMAYLASDKPVIFEAMIGERDFWRYSLSRNGFVIDEVEGKLTNLEVRCDYKHSQFLIESGNMWTIPKSWGKCSVYVYGDKDTRFTFGEVHSKEVHSKGVI
jgi:TonB family protein